MEAQRRILDLVADFLFFVIACLIILNAGTRISMMQTSLHRGLTDKGVSTVEANADAHFTGEELIALLCSPEGIAELSINGTTYSGNLSECVSKICADASYDVNRIRNTDGSVSLSVRQIE